MEIKLHRTYFKDATLGYLFVDTNPIFYTIERPWLGNQNNISCIPEGEYSLQPYSSPKFPEVWEVLNVPRRSAILIHAANFAEELHGCIAPGLSSGYMDRGGKPTKSVSDSVKAIKKIKELFGYEKHTLKITS